MDLNGKKILITSCGGLGDLIMFTPALRRIKEKYPACYITFMTSKKHRDVIAGLGYIDKVIYIERGKFLGRYRVLTDFWKQDAVVFTDWQPQLLVFSWLFGIPVRAGIPKQGHFLCKCFTKVLKNHVFRYEQYAAQTNAMVFSEALDIGLDGRMDKIDVSSPTKQDIISVDCLLKKYGLQKDGAYFLLTPFTGLEQRNWPLPEVKKFIQMVEERWHVPVLVVGPSDKWQDVVNITKYNLVGETTVCQLVELVRRAKCIITPDSGPMHIAGALGRPVVALFSKDLPSRWAPRQKCIPITLQLDCSPCNDDTARQCITLRCMRGITAEMAVVACEQLLSVELINEK